MIKIRDRLGRFVLGHPTTKEIKNKISSTLKEHPVSYWKGKKRPRKHLEKAWAVNRGRKMSPEERIKRSKRVRKHINYYSAERRKIIYRVEYKLWREAVFKRDDYTCIWCGERGYLEADHIQRWVDAPELRFSIDNGRTLCRNCHKKRHSNKEDE